MLPKFTIFQPNGWDNSILPIDIIHKLINQMNTTIDYINDMEDHSVERAKEYTDSQISIVNDSIASTNNTIDQINNTLQASIRSLSYSITTLQTQYNALSSNLSDLNTREANHYTEIGRAINQVYSDMNALGVQLRNYADIKDLVLKEQLETQIEDLRNIVNDLLNIKTIDGFTGSYKTVREIIGTKILYQTKLRGGNRYSMTWGQLSTTTKNGWFNKLSYTTVQNWNIFAPTWYNFKKATSSAFKNQGNMAMYFDTYNTWGFFVNNTMMFIARLVHNLTRQIPSSSSPFYADFSTADVYDYTEWSAYRYGTTQPTYSTKSLEDYTTGTTTYRQFLKTQFRIYCSTAYALSNWIYNAAPADVYLFDSTSINYLFMLILGNNFNQYNTDMLEED